MEKSKVLLANITWNEKGWKDIWSSLRAGHRYAQKWPGHESLNFKFDKKIDTANEVFGYIQWTNPPKNFINGGLIIFYSKNFIDNKNEIVGIYGDVEILNPTKKTQWDGFENNELISNIVAKKNLSLLFPIKLNADKYSSDNRIVPQVGYTYKDEIFAEEIITDEINQLKKSGDKLEELKKLMDIYQFLTGIKYGEKLEVGDVLTNDEIQKIFGCGNMGGMRRSLRNNCLVLVSDRFKEIYQDRWDHDILYYTGMGINGDQSLDFSQNKTLYESNESGINIYLFEALKEKEYCYRGKVKLFQEPFQEDQLGGDNIKRKVYIFPLKVLENNFILKEKDFIENNFEKEKIASKKSNEELNDIVNAIDKKTSKRCVISTQYERNPHVAIYTKRRADGFCELCENEAPFKDKNGEPFLEVHHIIWLSDGGSDNKANTVALCPNCHRKIHALNNDEDKKYLLDKDKELKHGLSS